MKFLEKKVTKEGFVTLVCEKEVLGVFKKKLEFISVDEIKDGFRDWKYLKNDTVVNEELSYQLDNWCNNKYLLPDLEDHIVYCSLGCPLKKEIETCVFNDIRAIENIEERCDYVRGLKDIPKRNLYKIHKKCFITRGGTLHEW